MPIRKLARLAGVVAALGAVGAGGALASHGSSGAYVVQPGDTLWAIAARSGTTVTALAAANGMDPTSILAIGRHLSIPSSSAAGGITMAATNATTPAPGATAPGRVVGSSWCAAHASAGGPSTLPSLLAESPGRLALRPLFVEWGWHYGVRPALLEAIAWQESGWQQGVVSGVGAIGIGQVMPATADFVETQVVGQQLSLSSPSDNIRIMAAYVGWLERHTTTTCDTIAAYYEGVANLSTYGVFQMTVPYVDDVEYLIPGFS